MHNKMTTAQNLNLNHFTIFEMELLLYPAHRTIQHNPVNRTSKAVQAAFLGFVIPFTITKGAVIHCSSGV
jgi:hypothetical protein